MRLLLTVGLIGLFACVAARGATYPTPPASCASKESGHGGVDCSASRPESISLHTDPPTLVKTVKNGKRYLGGSGNDTFHVVHLYSETDDLYEMGYALGQMFPEEIATMFDKLDPWLEGLLEKAVKWLPDWLAQLVIVYGAPVAIDLVYDITKDYIPAEYLREWQGIADGANCSIQRIRRVSLFPQLSKAACTILLAHNNATVNGGVNQLRALDFDPTSEVADFASVVIYHYKTKPQLANFGWIAMTGVLTGMNDIPMTVGEKKWGGHGAFMNLPLGLPWMQMLRQSLEYPSLDAVEKYIVAHNLANSSAPNSVAIHIGYGDGKSNKIIGYKIGYNYSQAYHSATQNVSPTHPRFDGMVWWSKNDPANTMCPADMIQSQYGKIDGEWMAMYYSPNDMTGDTQVAGFDLKQMKVYFANSRKSTADGPLCAYYRQRSLLDMKALFNETL